MFNVLGQHEGQDIISIEGGSERATKGQLNMTTVSVSGGPYTSLSGIEAINGWASLDGKQYLVVPTEILYPRVSNDQANSASTSQMADSQTQAQVAAAHYLKIPVTETVTVLQTVEKSPAEGVLKGGDRILKVNDEPLKGYKSMVDATQASEGKPIKLTVERDGAQQEHTLTPVKDEESGRWRVGVALKQDYEMPAKIKYHTEGVGGPSAGLMLALGTIEKVGEKSLLASGPLSESNYVAGTGTINAEGKVGPIGGAKYKIIAAGDKGVAVFLVPKENCSDVNEMRKSNPELLKYRDSNGQRQQMQIVAVENLDQAVQSLERIRDKGIHTDGLPTCG
jgi:PDZ domain family protein